MTVTDGADRVPAKRFIWRPTIEVDVDVEDLHAHGWHHRDECPANTGVPLAEDVERDDLLSVLDELHQLAHPDEPLDAKRCALEPCRDLFPAMQSAVSS